MSNSINSNNYPFDFFIKSSSIPDSLDKDTLKIYNESVAMHDRISKLWKKSIDTDTQTILSAASLKKIKVENDKLLKNLSVIKVRIDQKYRELQSEEFDKSLNPCTQLIQFEEKNIYFLQGFALASTLQYSEAMSPTLASGKITNNQTNPLVAIDAASELKTIKALKSDPNKTKEMGNYESRFVKLISSQFTPISVLGDGNCLPRAIIKETHPELIAHPDAEEERKKALVLRKKMIAHIKTNKERYTDVINDEDLEKHKQDKEFLDGRHIHAFAELLKRPIWVFANGLTEVDEKDKLIPHPSSRFGDEFSGKPICLLLSRDHYTLLLPKQQKEGKANAVPQAKGA